MPGPDGESCEGCRFWDEGPNGEGSCYRYPPVLVPQALDSQLEELRIRRKEADPVTEMTKTWVWCQPSTDHSDWCGEHRPKGP